MDEIKLDVQLRKNIGTSGSKAVRREGNIPAIVYGGESGPTAIKTSRKEYERIMRAHVGESVLFHINVFEGEEKLRDYSAIVKEAQLDPVSDQVVHIDFNRVNLKEKIEVQVQIHVKGEAAGFKEGGALDHVLWEIDVVCLPTDIPTSIDVDITELKLHDSIHVKDLALPPGVETEHDPEATVLAIVPAQSEDEETEGEEGEEPEVISEKAKEEGGEKSEGESKDEGSDDKKDAE